MNTIHILCNGTRHPLHLGASLDELFQELNLPPDSVVAEINNQIIQPDQYAQLQLNDGDKVELIRFVEGG